MTGRAANRCMKRQALAQWSTDVVGDWRRETGDWRLETKVKKYLPSGRFLSAVTSKYRVSTLPYLTYAILVQVNLSEVCVARLSSSYPNPA